MRRRALLGVAVGGLALGLVPAVSADLPFGDQGGDASDYTRLHITDGSCDGVAADARVPPGSDLPDSFDCRDTFKLSDYAAVPGDEDYDAVVASNPQELFGVRGPGTNRAWEVTTGRPDVVIAVMDSGIRWDEPRENLVNKMALNAGELPEPNGSDDHDANDDGFFNAADYVGDPRVADSNENELVDAQDLIHSFSDGHDDDGNGYADDISGWDFFEGDNDANDDVDYGHGTGESEDSAGEIGIDINPQCPNCMLLPMRVGDSFIADVNHFAAAAIYAVDNGVSVVQSALGTLNHTAFAQAAADYAYERGVLFVASAADEAAGHHNFPSALGHTMVVNSLTPLTEVEGVPVPTKTWLAFNGCTNFGGYIWVGVASTSCSSDAVGQSAGMAGLLYSAARNAVDLGVIEPDDSGQPLSAEEAKQLFRLGADDVDFSTPAVGIAPPNNFATAVPASQRYVTTAGWDQTTGWGRAGSNAMVRLVADGHIPPEADVTSPRWWQPLPASGSVPIVGRVDAPRAPSFTWDVQIAPGVQPPRFPLEDSWTTIEQGEGDAPIAGTLATLDLAQARALIDAAPAPYLPTDDPTSSDLPERDALRIRVRTHAVGTGDDAWTTAIEQRQVFVRDDPTLLAGWPRFLGADGAGSPAFEDIDADGVDELVIHDGNGYVHAFHADGSEAPGWPVHTLPLPLPSSGDNAFTRGDVQVPVYGALLAGAPAIADLDRDGDPEVAASDIEGNLYVWSHTGRLRPGFPVRGNAAFTQESKCQVTLTAACDDSGERDARDELNTVDHAFTSPPSAGDVDPATPGLELVASSNDGHVYAFHHDGTPVSGWPVLIRDPAKVATVDPVTHLVTYVEGSGARFGRKVLPSPALGDVDGDGDLEVAVNVNEEYEETPNTTDPLVDVIGLVQAPGNTRAYLLHHDGTAHAPTASSAASPHPDDQAYVDGWPVAVPLLTLELLPYVGEGSNGTPVLGDIDDDGDLEIATASIAGPPLVLEHDGTPYYGTGNGGRAITAATTVPGVGSLATDLPSVASLGGGALGHIGGAQQPIAFTMGASGFRRLLDVVLPEQQLLAEDHLGAWDAQTGQFLPGYPALMNDLQFVSTPSIADIDGDGSAEVLGVSAMYDLRAYGLAGAAPAGWPKQTGGWGLTTPAVGDLDGDGITDLAAATREGNLFVWEAAGPVCGAIGEWPKILHDLHNTARYGNDARRPAVVRDLRAAVDGDDVVLQWDAAHDDGMCGSADHYEVTASPTQTVDGETITLESACTADDTRTGSVRAVDDVGNRGYAATVDLVALCRGVETPRPGPAPSPAPAAELPATGGDGVSLLPLLLLGAATVVRATVGRGFGRRPSRRRAPRPLDRRAGERRRARTRTRR